MKIVIITAMPEETRAILEKAAQVEKTVQSHHSIWRFRAGGHDIILCESGMGSRNAGSAASAITSEKPDLMISAGFGGGVLPGLKVADVVMAEQLLFWTGVGLEQVPVPLYGLDSGCTSFLLRGSFVSCDSILNKKQLAELLPKSVKQPVVEMESTPVARVAFEHGISFLGIRAISDPWDEELSFSISEFCDDEMRIRAPRVFTTILRRPYIIPQLIRLARNSRKAAKSLGEAVEQLLRQL
ncbi:MAG: phosphorylase [Geobacter sp.]|nr:MAG: phosphorylase [Geobacter sp.]